MKYLSDFNILPSFTTIQTAAIQDAINQTSAAGEILVFNKGTYLTGLLEMKDNTAIEFETGTAIIGSSQLSDYEGSAELFVDAVGSQRGRCLLYAHSKQNISLKGSCVIDGRLHNFSKDLPGYAKRPFLLNFINCKNITLDGILFKNSPAWMLCISKCNGFTIENVTIFSRTGGNNDGIDINSSQNGVIRNCVIDTDDDAVCIKSTYDSPCENILIEDCMLCTNWGAFKIGTESMGDIKNIHIRNCFMHDVKGGAIKILSADGANISDIIVENITFLDVTGPIFITNGNRLRSYYETNTRTVAGKISNVTIKNISGNVKNALKHDASKVLNPHPAVIAMTGMANTKLENITLSNIDLIFESGEFTASEKISEIGSGYPEFNRIGIPPASKIFAINIDNLIMDNVSIELENTSSLPEVILENVNK